MIRSPGLAGDPPAWFGQAGDVPRAVHAGLWIAQPGQFFDGWGRRAGPAELPAVAAAQAARTGWAKIIADWLPGDEPVPAGVLTAVVAAVHAVGGRVAVHSQHAAGGAAAVAAGVDSLEHGMGLDPELLPSMAERGIALTPTLRAMTGSLEAARQGPDSPRKDWYLAGATDHRCGSRAGASQHGCAGRCEWCLRDADPSPGVTFTHRATGRTGER